MKQVEGMLLLMVLNGDDLPWFNMLEMDYLEEVSWIRMAFSLPAGLVKAAKLRIILSFLSSSWDENEIQ